MRKSKTILTSCYYVIKTEPTQPPEDKQNENAYERQVLSTQVTSSPVRPKSLSSLGLSKQSQQTNPFHSELIIATLIHIFSWLRAN